MSCHADHDPTEAFAHVLGDVAAQDRHTFAGDGIFNRSAHYAALNLAPESDDDVAQGGGR